MAMFKVSNDMWGIKRRRALARKENHKKTRDRLNKKLKRQGLKVDRSYKQFTSFSAARAAFRIQKANKQGKKQVAAYVSSATSKELVTLCRFARKSASVTNAVYKNPNTTVKQLKEVAHGSNASKSALLNKKDLHSDVVAICFKVSKGKTKAQGEAAEKIKNKALRHKECPQKYLRVDNPGMLRRALMTDEAIAQLDKRNASVLSNPSTSAAELAKGDISNYYHAIEMVKNPSLSPETLKAIQDKWSNNPAVGKEFNDALSKRKDAPTEVIDQLAKSKDSTVISNLASWVDENILGSFFGKHAREVRLAMANRLNLSPETQAYLMKFPEDTGLMLKLAAHPGLSEENQNKLYRLENNKEIIAINLAKNTSLVGWIKQDIIDSGNEKAHQKLAMIGVIPTEEPEMPVLIERDLGQLVKHIPGTPAAASSGPGGACKWCGKMCERLICGAGPKCIGIHGR